MTFPRCLSNPLAVESWDSLSFLELSDEPPPIAPEIVPPRRGTIPPSVEDSRCATAVKERIGGFDARGKDEVRELGDNGVSVDVGERNSAARAESRPCSIEVCSVRIGSSEYVDEPVGLWCT